MPASNVSARKALPRNGALALVSALLLAGGLRSTLGAGAKVDLKKKKIDFNRDVRPIVDKCLACHGHDPKAIQAGLRLDTREGAIKMLQSGQQAIVPGHTEKSELISRINAKDPADIMPPPSSNKILSAEEKATLRDWIAEGAEYKQHWAFVKPVRPPLPPVKDTAWSTNPIDRFILAKLEDNGFKPNPEADKQTLLRRVSLDLTGLPPSAADADAFLADKSSNAYEKVVDRLLASPRYGERMAMDWMDYARYADSNGYQADWERYQYRWRDWVIDAYNKNLPYDQFTVQQLAGDLLPHPTRDQIIATGFNRNHRINTEGGVIAEEWRVETVIDRVETTSAVWLGLTTGCARCHDHKYDPISQKDFYSLCSYFNNVPESGTGVEQPVNHPPFIKAPYPEQERQLMMLKQKELQLNKAESALVAQYSDRAQAWQPPAAEFTDGLQARYQLGSSIKVEGTAPAPTLVGKPTFDKGISTGAIKVDNNNYADLGNVGDFDSHKPFTYSLWMFRDGDEGSPIARMDENGGYRGWDLMLNGGRPAAHLISKWPENAIKVISKMEVPKGAWSQVTVTYDGSSKASGFHIYVNGLPTENDVDKDSLNGDTHTAVSTKIGRRTDGSHFMGKVDNLAFYNRVLSADDVKRMVDFSRIEAIVKTLPAKRAVNDRDAVTRYWAETHDPKFVQIEKEAAAAVKSRQDVDNRITTVMVMQEMAKPREAHVLIRGQYDHPGEVVTASVPAALPPLPKGAPNNRLGLAEWIVSPENPLTSRVTVNRMWERLFGTGIVETSEDFGTRSEFPSHPELLDWLSTELIEKKWDLKALWKEMVMSRAYRQSSAETDDMRRLDSANRLITRGPRFRLPAEVLRDQAMFAGGFLTEKVGGPSVKPYQPNGVWDDVSVYGNLHNYKHDMGGNLHRRSLYTIWKRTAAPPDMTLFDVPSREICRVRRARTDTPLQALVLLNDETYLEAARGLAQRMITKGGDSAASRVQFGFKALLGRAATAQEQNIIASGIEKRIQHYRADVKSANELKYVGDLPQLDGHSPAEVAAYTVAASTMLNLDETVTKQ